MSERFSRLGVLPEHFAHARHFEHVFKGLGMTPAQIDSAIKWGAEFNGKPEDLMPQFDQLCEQHNIERVNADLAISWRDQVIEKGIEAMPQPPAPAPADAAKRLHEIEQDMKKPRSESRYWGQDPTMRDEYRELLEHVGDNRGEYVPGQTGNDSARKAEIEQMMRTDRAAYYRSGADQEYMAILQRAEDGEETRPAPAGAAGARRAEIEALMKSDRATYHRSGADKEYLEILQREAGETPDAGPGAEANPSNNTQQENQNESQS